MDETQNLIAVQTAAERIGVTPGTLYYYIRRLGLSTKRYDLDPLSYLTLEDYDKIKTLKDARRARQQLRKNV